MTDPIYRYVPHRRTQAKTGEPATGPTSVVEALPHGTAAERFNSWLAVKVTRGVGTMWCAYAFAILACISLPSAINTGSAVVVVSWISQTFLQLVLLSVVLVGQNVLAATAERRADETHGDAGALLHESVKLQDHLAAQDAVIARMAGALARVEARLG
jgi:hypothetical protein